MSRKTAGLSFLGICATLAVLLVAGVITPLVSSFAFAVTLVVFGVMSRGFTS
jgi:hypothetical protein